MEIQDLAISKELSQEECAALRGGGNATVIGGLNQLVFGGQDTFASPVTAVAINAPTVTNVDMTSFTKTISNSLEALDSNVLAHQL